MMHSFDGDFRSVSKAVLYTVNDLLEGHDKELSLFNRDFSEESTLELYQHPVEGWITKDPKKLQGLGSIIRFRYKQETVPPSLELDSCQEMKPMSQTALKALLFVSKLFRECQIENQDIPAAQPLSLSDWNFPIKSIWISAKIFREFKEVEKIQALWETLTAKAPEADFAIGMPYAAGGGILPIEGRFSLGDIVVVRRSEGAPTFAKVIKTEPLLKVAVKIVEGRISLFKDYSYSQIPSNILARL